MAEAPDLTTPGPCLGLAPGWAVFSSGSRTGADPASKPAWAAQRSHLLAARGRGPWLFTGQRPLQALEAARSSYHFILGESARTPRSACLLRQNPAHHRAAMGGRVHTWAVFCRPQRCPGDPQRSSGSLPGRPPRVSFQPAEHTEDGASLSHTESLPPLEQFSLHPDLPCQYFQETCRMPAQ